MFSLDSFKKACPTDEVPLNVRGQGFRFLVPRFLEPYLNPEDPLDGFPLWAKIWEASLVLADVLAGTPAVPGRRILEIGGGIGVVGVVAAFFGHQITVSDFNTQALTFAEANRHLNLPGDMAHRLEIRALDWTAPSSLGTFDLLLGSEIVYRKEDYGHLLHLFEQAVAPGGEILLCEGIRKASMDFFAMLQGRYSVKAMRKTLRSRDTSVPLVLARIRTWEGEAPVR